MSVSQVPLLTSSRVDQTAANGGGAWTGNVFVENLEITRTTTASWPSRRSSAVTPLAWTDATT